MLILKEDLIRLNKLIESKDIKHAKWILIPKNTIETLIIIIDLRQYLIVQSYSIKIISHLHHWKSYQRYGKWNYL